MQVIKQLAGAILTVAAGFANAALIEYDFNGSDGNLGPSETFTEDGVSIDVSAYYWADFDSPLAAANIRREDGALGVRNAQDADDAIDNSGSYDLLAILLPTFAGPVEIEFDGVGSNDDWIIAWATDLVGLNTSTPTTFFASSNILGSITDDEDSYSFAFNSAINWLFIGAAKRTDGSSNDDEFYVDNLKIRTVTTAVPEPTTLALFGAGLLGLGIMQRRKRI